MLALIENMQYAVTVDVLHMVRNNSNTSFLSEALEGHCIYDGGYCKLRLSYSRHIDLNVKIFFSRFWPLLQHQHQCVSEKKSKDLEVQSSIKHDDDDVDLCRDDAEMVMKRLGLLTDPESEGLQKRYSSEELSNLFEEKEPSLEEVKQAFDVFDENRDGFIDPIDLQRVMTILGLKQGSKLENCRRMIRSFDGNKDGRIDFHGFVKFMENNFC